MQTTAPSPVAARPWWRFGIAWLVFGLPAAAVVAASLSAVVAVRGADPVVADRRAGAHQAAEARADGDDAMRPAELARNRASLVRRQP